MVRSEERMRILSMLQEGKISAEEASRLLTALGQSSNNATKSKAATSGRNPRQLRVRITDTVSGRNKVNVNIPMGLVNIGLKMGARFIPNDADIDIEELKEAVEAGHVGKIVEFEDTESGERVEVWLE
ncbi:MAG: DUF2089 domain-containing protein [Chloroflexi bacterium]|nr:DUF2089 domain-containing protein [Chloroflexota bacterium]